MLMEILTSVRRLYISFKSLVNDFVYSFGRAALLLLVEVQNRTVPVRERSRIRVNHVNEVTIFLKKLTSDGGSERRDHIGLQSILLFLSDFNRLYKRLIIYSLMILDLLQILSVSVRLLYAYRGTDGRTDRTILIVVPRGYESP